MVLALVPTKLQLAEPVCMHWGLPRCLETREISLLSSPDQRAQATFGVKAVAW